MAERDRSPVAVHMWRIIGKAELAQHCERLGGEGFVEFDEVEVGDLQPKALHQFL